MRPHGIVLGAAVLSGIVAASVTSGQPGSRTAVQVIAPAGFSANALLGAPGAPAPAPGLVPAWLLVPTLPDLPAPAPDRTGAPAASPAAAPAPVPATTPLAAVLASAPVHAPVVLGGLPSLPHLPLPVGLPPVVTAPPAGHPGHHHHRGGDRQG
jgi:hypothetical protein